MEFASLEQVTDSTDSIFPLKAGNEAKEANTMIEFLEKEESKCEIGDKFVEIESCEKKKRKHSVLDSSIDSSFIGQKHKREKIEEEPSEIALAEDLFFIIQDLQILASNNFIHSFLDVHLLLNSFMEPIPYQNLLYSDSFDLIIDSQSVILIVSLSLFDYRSEKGKQNFQNSLIENLLYINSTFNHLYVIFEDRYAQNKASFLFAQDVSAILEEICTNIQVRTCFCFTTNDIFKHILFFIREVFNKSNLEVKCWKNRDFLLIKEEQRVKKLTKDGKINPFIALLILGCLKLQYISLYQFLHEKDIILDKFSFFPQNFLENIIVSLQLIFKGQEIQKSDVIKKNFKDLHFSLSK
jgi:hypothetical protein